MSEYDDNIGVVIYHLSKILRNQIQAEFNKLGLHAGQEHLLLCLMNVPAVRQSDLVKDLCVEPPTITKMLQRMEKAGLVDRYQDREDGRNVCVKVTAQGKALQQPILDVWGDLEKQMLANMTMAEQVLLRRLLMQILTNLTAGPDET